MQYSIYRKTFFTKYMLKNVSQNVCTGAKHNPMGSGCYECIAHIDRPYVGKILEYFWHYEAERIAAYSNGPLLRK